VQEFDWKSGASNLTMRFYIESKFDFDLPSHFSWTEDKHYSSKQGSSNRNQRGGVISGLGGCLRIIGSADNYNQI
jgi:hypothetical protein